MTSLIMCFGVRCNCGNLMEIHENSDYLKWNGTSIVRLKKYDKLILCDLCKNPIDVNKQEIDFISLGQLEYKKRKAKKEYAAKRMQEIGSNADNTIFVGTRIGKNLHKRFKEKLKDNKETESEFFERIIMEYIS